VVLGGHRVADQAVGVEVDVAPDPPPLAEIVRRELSRHVDEQLVAPFELGDLGVGEGARALGNIAVELTGVGSRIHRRRSSAAQGRSSIASRILVHN
jgi:hypothetical protein